MVLSMLMGSIAARAQDLVPFPPSPDQFAPAPQAAPQGAVAQAPVYSQGQIDQLLAPIALYPDPLVGQILMASTYPLEVVEASRWLQDSGNAALHGDDLANAMQQQTWDPSVKSLVAFPQVLQMMNGNLQWTEQLGDAFLAQQPQVMGEVQHLRQQAQAQGNLNSTPQQTVTTQGPDIVIQPAQPQVVYVPVYNPTVVYGPWLYPAYPPYYFSSYYFPGAVFAGGLLIGFGIGIAIIDPLWGWWHWDWYNHRIDIDDHRYADLNRGRGPVGNGGVWQHDSDHRRGVPYRDAATRARFLGASANSPEARRTFRGFPAAAQNRTASFNAARGATRTAAPAAQNAMRASAYNGRVANGRVATSGTQRSTQAPQAQRAAAPRSVAPMQRPSYSAPQRAAPVYESYAPRAQVQAQSARGAVSRSSAASHQAPAARAPASRSSAPARSGGGGSSNSRQR
jgi:hypothetical protein